MSPHLHILTCNGMVSNEFLQLPCQLQAQEISAQDRDCCPSCLPPPFLYPPVTRKQAKFSLQVTWTTLMQGAIVLLILSLDEHDILCCQCAFSCWTLENDYGSFDDGILACMICFENVSYGNENGNGIWNECNVCANVFWTWIFNKEKAFS